MLQQNYVSPAQTNVKKTRHKKHEKKRFSTPAVYRLRHSETKNIVSRNVQVVLGIKTVFDSRNMFSSEHAYVPNKDQCLCFSLSTKTSLINVSTMFCLPCALSRTHFEMQNRLDICLSDSRNTVMRDNIYHFGVTQTNVKNNFV